MKKLNKRDKFKLSLNIPLEGNSKEKFFCRECGQHLATGYSRIVVGDRGPYIEFSEENMILNNLFYPKNQEHKFFIEYSSSCEHKVFVYFQQQTVSYADYKIGFYYIAPELLSTEKVKELVDKNIKEKQLQSLL